MSCKIVNITSMGGRRIALPPDSIYHGSKFALEGLSDSTQYELELFGIKIILIESEAVGSNFWKNLKTSSNVSSDPNNYPYFQWRNSMSQSFEKVIPNAIHPSVVAKVILDVIKSDDPQLRYAVGNDDAAMAIEARRNISDREFIYELDEEAARNLKK